MCGADLHVAVSVAGEQGSPPRVRSRRRLVVEQGYAAGITSACAEQTPCRRAERSRSKDHLRVCGADQSNTVRWDGWEGSPPRVRSRPGWASDGQRRERDHLRVCGADSRERQGSCSSSGSPPRVRSRPTMRNPAASATGITSACAEQTLSRLRRIHSGGDHLRVCGADYVIADTSGVEPGSPPRVRSRQRDSSGTSRADGITSACAEQTSFKEQQQGLLRDHLRVCGADP